MAYRDLQLNSGMRCAKFMLLIVSFMFAITAVLLIMVGVTIQTIFGDFSQFLDDHFLSPPALLVAIGIIMLFVAALGAFGAIKESVMLINLYGVALFLVFILEVSAAIAAFVMQTQVSSMLVRTMTDSFSSYYGNEAYNEYIRTGVDFMQEGLECCGIDGPNDWKIWSPLQNETDDTNLPIYVPDSCCSHFNTIDMENGAETVCEDAHIVGCYHRMEFIISQSTMLIATGATTVAFVQLLGVLCAFMLAKALRRNKSIREARRWQMQQSLGVLISGGKMSPHMHSPMSGYSPMEKSQIHFEQDPHTYTPSSPSVN